MLKELRLLLRIITYYGCFLGAGFLQAQIIIAPTQMQTEVFNFDQLFQLNLINPSPQEVEGFLELDVESRTGESLIKMTSDVLRLEAGEIKQSTAINWGNSIELGRNQFIASISETGRLPYGEYTFCYRFVERTGQILGVKCQENSAKTYGLPELLSPYDEAVIQQKNPLLTWKPPLPLISKDVAYSIRLTVLNEGQSPNKALRVNFPLLEESGINQTFLPYPIDAFPLEMNQSYVWQVSASYNGIPLGETAIWVFRLQEDKTELVNNPERESYRFVKPQLGAAHYMANETVYFAYDNRLHEKTLNYTIYIEDNPREILVDLPSIELRAGVNTIDLDATILRGIIADEIYVLRIQDRVGEYYYLKFKYQEGTNEASR